MFWLVLAIAFLMMGALTHHFLAALRLHRKRYLVTSLGAMVNVLPLFFDGEE